MTKIIINICAIVSTTFLFISCGLGGMDVEEIALNENSTVIDVRTEREFRGGHLKNALNIPYGEISNKISEHVTDKNKEIILYCRSGRRSGIAKKVLNDRGYTNVINAGSYKKLKRHETDNQNN
jgi:phage shock protein E